MKKILLVLALALQASAQEEPKVVTIDGVEYRALTAEQMKRVVLTYKERDNLKVQVTILEDTAKSYELLVSGKENELRLVTEKLTKEKEFWETEYYKENKRANGFYVLFRSCTGRVFGLFRICRL